MTSLLCSICNARTTTPATLPDGSTVCQLCGEKHAIVMRARGTHPICGELRFEQVRQDRRSYYRTAMGSLTDLEHAAQTVEYWRSRGWLDDADSATVSALASTFGAEWDALNDSDRALIVRDCTDTNGGTLESIASAGAFAEYRQNIGPGNLERYALTQRVRFRRVDGKR